MGRNIFGILLILTGIAIGYFWSYPTWNEISGVKAQKVEVDATLERIRVLSAKRDEISAKYNSITEEEKGRLSEFFPSKPDSGVWLINMSNLAASNGILLKSIAMEEGREKQVKLTENGNAAENNIETFVFDVSISGGYSSFLSFLDSMEKSRRLIEIETVNFNSGEGKRDFYEFTLKAHTFWKK